MVGIGVSLFSEVNDPSIRDLNPEEGREIYKKQNKDIEQKPSRIGRMFFIPHSPIRDHN